MRGLERTDGEARSDERRSPVRQLLNVLRQDVGQLRQA
jgi:hypothetical protein